MSFDEAANEGRRRLQRRYHLEVACILLTAAAALALAMCIVWWWA